MMQPLDVIVTLQYPEGFNGLTGKECWSVKLYRWEQHSANVLDMIHCNERGGTIRFHEVYADRNEALEAWSKLYDETFGNG